MLRNCRFLYCTAGEGGVAYLRTTTARIVDSRFEGCTSGLEGGAIYCAYGATPRIERCEFTGLEATKGGCIASFEGSRPHALDCTFEDNHAGSGGVAYAFEASVVLESCRFDGNDGTTTGGACYFKTCPTQSRIVDCTFTDNGGASGGCITIEGASLLVSNCTFAGNHATNYGAGVRAVMASTLAMNNCIVAFSTQGQGVYADATGTIQLGCCDLFGNPGGDWTGTIAGQLGLNGNISRDPLFCEMNPLLPYLLQGASPCAPGGTAGCGQIGAWPVGCGSPQAIADRPDARGGISLAAPEPSPFRADARLDFAVPPEAAGERLRLDVLDAGGRCVRGLLDGPVTRGSHGIVWDGRDDAGRAAPGGIYYFRLECRGSRSVARGVLLR